MGTYVRGLPAPTSMRLIHVILTKSSHGNRPVAMGRHGMAWDGDCYPQGRREEVQGANYPKASRSKGPHSNKFFKV